MHPQRTPLPIVGSFSLFAALCIAGAFAECRAADAVNGNLIMMTDNGAWCWYQDERVVVDPVNGKLLIGSVANDEGIGGTARQGDIDVTAFDPATGGRRLFTLKENFLTGGTGDDHNVPAFWIRPDGRYLAMYAGHNNDYLSRYRISANPHDASSWGAEQIFDWNANVPGGSDFKSTYSNLFYLSTENRLYNFSRSDNRSPNFMVSGDNGSSWTYGGKLTYTPANVGYVNGYFKYTSNGTDRIDFIGTEHHPRDFNTSIYHGYLQGGKTYRADGTLMDGDLFDENAPRPADFTTVFAANTVVAGLPITHCWTTDLQRYADGSLGAIFTSRADSSITDHRLFYGRFDGAQWSTTYLGKAGSYIAGGEQDYTGLGALNPNDPNSIYISTSFDPRDGASLNNHEIFKGRTSDHGANWEWSPVTWNSSADNSRPVVPAWNANDTALLWFRGTYDHQLRYDAAIVGVIERNRERVAPAKYVDAALTNTTLANGTPLATTGPNASQGATDNQWHTRTGFGNGGSVLTAGEIAAEDAPALKTTATVAAGGIYDVWAYFWANPAEDWRIKAGMIASDLLVFRRSASEQVEIGDTETPLTLSGGSNTFLYKAYLGRTTLAGNALLDVYLDDFSAGSTGQTRTWYDGIAYAGVMNLPTPLVWNGGAQPNAAWSAAGNWASGTAPENGSAQSLAFGGSINLNPANDVANLTAVELTFAPDAGSFTLSGNALILGGDVANNSVNEQTLDLPLTLANGYWFFKATVGELKAVNVISGTGSPVKSGPHRLTLTGANTYAGRTILNEGLIRFSALNNLGANATIDFNGGGLQWAAGNATDISVRTLEFFGNAVFDTNGNNVVLANAVGNGGGGGLVKKGTGTLTLQGNNTYQGTTAIHEGTIRFSAAGNLGTGNIDFRGGTLQWAGGNTEDVSPRFLPISASVQARIDTNGNNVSFAAPLTGGGGLTKSGAGTLTLNDANSYAGPTIIDGGTLKLQGSTAPLPSLPAGSIAWFDAADADTLVLGGGRVQKWINKGTAGPSLDAAAYAAAPVVGGPTVKTGGLNGNDVLQFDGAQGLRTLGNLGLTGAENRSLFVVGHRGGGDMYLASWGNLGTNNQAFGILVRASSALVYFTWGNDLAGGNVDPDADHTYAFLANGNSGAAYLDGAANGTKTFAMNTGDTPLYLGSRYVSTYSPPNQAGIGALAEVIVYDRFLADADRQAVENYLHAKWFDPAGARAHLLPIGTAVNLTAAGATLDLNGFDQAVGSLTGVAGSQVLLGGATFTVGGDDTSTTFAGAFAGAGTFVKTGAGTLTLSEDIGYLGDTLVEQGEMHAKNFNPATAASARIEVLAGASLFAQSIRAAALSIGTSVAVSAGADAPTVPEPSVLLLIAAGLAAWAFSRISHDNSPRRHGGHGEEGSKGIFSQSKR
ncbi:MAG: autotransporter-associated beta strand repeat-containing protein [Pirellulales bacterium]|nr:autotransporter-associated beta strand repeat-containing protein [Pirellulales bacterium]